MPSRFCVLRNNEIITSCVLSSYRSWLFKPVSCPCAGPYSPNSGILSSFLSSTTEVTSCFFSCLWHLVFSNQTMCVFWGWPALQKEYVRWGPRQKFIQTSSVLFWAPALQFPSWESKDLIAIVCQLRRCVSFACIVIWSSLWTQTEKASKGTSPPFVLGNPTLNTDLRKHQMHV